MEPEAIIAYLESLLKSMRVDCTTHLQVKAVASSGIVGLINALKTSTNKEADNGEKSK